MRTPFVSGSIAGVVGTSAAPLNLSRSSPSGGRMRTSESFVFDASTGGLLVLHGSQASPTPSPSASAWLGFATSGQLSPAPQKPSPSSSLETSTGHAALAPKHAS